MAIVQISRITNRKGLQEDLPQLAGAELGWSVDERRLFIGNGTIQEGAPVVGNTEILTEFSDILNFQTTYTYKGDAAGYTVQTGPSVGTPVTQSLQSWMDQWASVKDFGAVGDGITDDTDAINRALYQLYCRETNVAIRRSLYFPAGVYVINESIIIPPYATLIGEGPDNSIIQMAAGADSALRAYVARTGDNLQQTGINIGTNGAIVPQYVTIQDMAFETLDDAVDVFLVEDATNCTFQNVGFFGPLTTANLTTDINNTAGVRFNSTSSLITSNILLDNCVFSGTSYGIKTDVQIKGAVVSNSSFNTLYQGVVLGVAPVNGGPTGFKVLQNVFDNIYAQGIYYGSISLNATGYNIFYDVGNNFNGTTNPATSVIYFGTSNNISVSDMFQRADNYAIIYQRIDTNNQASIGIVNGRYIKIGPSSIEANPQTVLTNNVSNTTLYTFDASVYRTSTMTYSIVRDTSVRQGTLRVVPTGGGTLTYDDDYIEDLSTGVTFSVAQVGSTVSIKYSTSNTGIDGSIAFTVSNVRI